MTADKQPRIERRAMPPKGTLGGSNRLLSSRDVAVILAIPERTGRDKWTEWGLPPSKIGKHLRWKERDVYAWIERQSMLAVVARVLHAPGASKSTQ